MKYLGLLYYSEEDAKRNSSFINELIKEAYKQQIELKLKLEHEKVDSQESIDFVWNRTRNYKLAVSFENRNIQVFNNSLVNKIANNKWLTFELAKKLKIPSIPTWRKINEQINYPIVVKSISGHGGKQVALCYSKDEVNKFIQLFGEDATIIQPFIESNNQDIRTWVLGNKILGSVLRTGTSSFKSNYTLGGTIEKISLPNDVTNYIHQIVEYVKSDYIGIDFIRSKDGTFYLNELEDPVGARSFYDLYDVNLSKLLISYMKQSLDSK